MPIDYDMLAKRGLISPDAAAQYGLTGDPDADARLRNTERGVGAVLSQPFQGPSWAEQAQQFANRDPHDLLVDPAFTQFVMGMVGPGSTKNVRGGMFPELPQMDLSGWVNRNAIDPNLSPAAYRARIDAAMKAWAETQAKVKALRERMANRSPPTPELQDMTTPIGSPRPVTEPLTAADIQAARARAAQSIQEAMKGWDLPSEVTPGLAFLRERQDAWSALKQQYPRGIPAGARRAFRDRYDRGPNVVDFPSSGQQ